VQSNREVKDRDNQGKFETEFRGVNTFSVYSYFRAQLCQLCCLLPLELEAQWGVRRTGWLREPGALPAGAADGGELVSLHSSVLCMGQLAWRPLQQASFFGQEIASFSYRECLWWVPSLLHKTGNKQEACPSALIKLAIFTSQ